MTKASDYLDKVMTLCLPAEREALLQSGVCERFSGIKKGPAAGHEEKNYEQCV